MSKSNKRAVIEMLEPRVLYSADPLSVIFELNTESDEAEERRAQPVAVFDSASVEKLSTSPAPSPHTAAEETTVLHGNAAARESAIELVFVDTSTEHYQRTLDQIHAATGSETTLEIVFLQNTSSHAASIDQALQNYRHIEHIHVIAEGFDDTDSLNTALQKPFEPGQSATQQDALNTAQPGALEISVYGSSGYSSLLESPPESRIADTAATPVKHRIEADGGTVQTAAARTGQPDNTESNTLATAVTTLPGSGAEPAAEDLIESHAAFKQAPPDNTQSADLSSGITLNSEGNNSYLLSDAPLIGGLGELTVEFSFSVHEVSTENVLVSYATPTNNNEFFLTVHDNGTLSVHIAGSALLTSSADYAFLLDGEHHHLALTWVNNNALSIYADGELQDTLYDISSNATIGNGGELLIGQEQDAVLGGFNPSQQLRGTLYDVRIWSEALSAAEIALNAGHKVDPASAPSTLLVNWQMQGIDESGQILDSLGSSHLSIGHVIAPGFNQDSPFAALSVAENATVGTSVAYISSAESYIEDVALDGRLLNAAEPAGLVDRYHADGSNAGNQLGAWTVTDGSVDLVGIDHAQSPLGGRVIDLDGSSPGTMSQTLNTEIGMSYQVVFALSGDFNGGDTQKQFRVSAGATSETFSLQQPNNWQWGHPNSFAGQSMTFTASSTSTTLEFESLASAFNAWGAMIADIQVIEIPAAISTLLAADSALTYDAGTNKFYKYVHDDIEWNDALLAANNTFLNQTAGQLVRIESAYENALVHNLTPSNESTWIGASDQDVEGDFRWYEGTTATDLFWQGTVSGSAQNHYYSNFSITQPNGLLSASFVYMDDNSAEWRDTSSIGDRTYVVEWDASAVLNQLTYSIADPSANFDIDASSGEVSVAASNSLNHQNNDFHDVDVSVSNAAGAVTVQTLRIDVTTFNEPPVATGNTVSTNEDQSHNFSVAEFLFTDGQSDPLASVTLTNLQLQGGTLTHTAGSVNVTEAMTITAAQLTGLLYTPAADNHTDASFDYSVNDTHSGSVSATMDIEINAVNDAPTGTDNTITVNADGSYVFSLADFGYNDSDNHNLMQVWFTSLPADGDLLYYGSTFTANNWVSASDIASGTLSYVPTADTAGQNYASFNFQVQDDGGTSNGGASKAVDENTITIDVVSLNQAPQIMHSYGPAQAFINEFHYENIGADADEFIEIVAPTGTDLSGWSLVFYDGSTGLSYDTRPLSGILSEHSNGFGLHLESFSDDTILNGNGGIALVNASNSVLQFLSYGGSFTATNGPASGISSTDTGVQENAATQLGHSLQASGPLDALTWTSDTAHTAGSINTGQSFHPAPIGAETMQEDTSLVFSAATANALSVSDSDAAAGDPDPLKVTLSAQHGKLIIFNTAGLTGVVGNGASQVSFSGSVAEINAALEGLQYTPFEHYNGDDVITLLVDDQGNTGGPAETASAAVAVSISAANDAPTFNAGTGFLSHAYAPLYNSAVDVALQADGKYLVLVAANTAASGQNIDFFLSRVHPDGSLDLSFGNNGTIDAGINGNNETPKAITVLDDGSILISGAYIPSGSTLVGAVMHINSDGTLDTAFGAGGLASVTLPGSTATTINDIEVLDDGGIILAGHATVGGDKAAFVAQLQQNGSLDTAFSTDGFETFTAATGDSRFNALSVDAAGVVYAVGSSDDDLLIASYAADGSLNTTFDVDGVKIIDIGTALAVPSGIDYANTIQLDANDNLVIGGYTNSSGNGDSLVLRMDNTGVLDTGFGSGGIVVVAVGSPYEALNQLHIQHDGKILATGDAYNGSNNDASVFRLMPDGSLDTSFHGDGILRADFSGFTDSSAALLVDHDGNIVIVGRTDTNGSGNSFIAKYNPEGELHRGFMPQSTTGSSVSYTEDGSPTVLESSAEIFDAELSALDNFNGSSISLQRATGAHVDDEFVASGSVAALLQGGDIVVSGTVIGTVDQNSGGTLALSFNNSASNALMNQLLQQIAYQNNSETADAVLQIDWIFSDGNSGAQGSGPAYQALGSTSVSVSTVNDAPQITSNGGGPSAAISVLENTTGVTTVSASDPDSATLSYTISGGADAAAFTLDASTGVLSFITPPDIDNPVDSDGDSQYLLQVNADDGAGGVDTQAITVDVQDGSEPLQLAAPGTVTTDEDSAVVFSTANGNSVRVIEEGPVDRLIETLISVQSGSLTLAQTTGLSIIEGSDGSSSIRFQATADASNAALDGLRFDPVPNATADVSLSIDSRFAASELLGLYSFDQGDASAQGTASSLHDGLLNNDAAVVTDAQRGEVLSLDGNSDYVQINSTFGQPANLTLSAWVKYSSAGANGGEILSIGDDVAIRVDDGLYGVSAFFWDGSSYQFLSTSENIADDQWHHVALSFDDSNNTQTLYIDGEIADSASSTQPIGYGHGFAQTTIGTHASLGTSAYDFNGLIDDASVHGRALSHDEIVQLAQQSGHAQASTLIQIDAVNDLPVAGANTVPLTEDQNYQFNAGDFPFSDVESDALVSITLDNLQLQGGTLSHSAGSVVLSNGMSVTAAQLATLVFSPTANSSVDASFDFAVNDADSGTSFATLLLQIIPVNDPPVATGNTVLTDEDQPYDFSVADFSFTDIENNALQSVTLSNLQLQGGTLSHSGGSVLVTDGMNISAAQISDLRFSPAANNNTDASFSYAVNDADGGAVSATLVIQVDAVNDPPVATGNTVSTLEDQSYLFSANDFLFTDQESNPGISATLSNLMLQGGSLSHSGGAVNVTEGMTLSEAQLDDLRYTPAPNSSANASFDYAVNDADPGVVTAAMVVQVDAVNDPPVATGNTVIMHEDQSYIFSASDFLFNDVESDALVSVTLTDLQLQGGSLSHSSGSVTVSAGMLISAAELQDLTFVPALHSSANASFSYAVNDADSGAVTATLAIQINAVNDRPVATGNTVSTVEDQAYAFSVSDFLFNDAESDPLASVTLTDLQLQGGTLSHSGGAVQVSDGMLISAAQLADLTFNPAANSNANASFSYTVNDADSGVVSATLDIQVDARNDPPVATGNSVSIFEDNSYDFTAVDFPFSDVESDNLASITVHNLQLSGGTLSHSGGTVQLSDGMTVSAVELMDLRYTPAANSSANASFEYAVNDADNGVATATLAIEVNAVNDRPVATGNTVSTLEDQPYVFSVADFLFIDVESDALVSVTLSNLQLQGGSMSHSSGSVLVSEGMQISAAQLADLTFSPAANSSANASFSYAVNDADSGVIAATLTVQVDAVNDAPVFTSFNGLAAATASLAENTLHAADFSAQDVDSVGALSFAISGGEDAALFTLDPSSGSLHFIEAPDFEAASDHGADNRFQLDVSVADSEGALSTQSLSLDLLDQNEAPTQLTLSNSTLEALTDTTGGFAVGDLSASDQDHADTLSFSLVGGADRALFTLAGSSANTLLLDDGVVRQSLQPSYQVIIQATDAGGLSTQQSFSVTIAPEPSSTDPAIPPHTVDFSALFPGTETDPLAPLNNSARAGPDTTAQLTPIQHTVAVDKAVQQETKKDTAAGLVNRLQPFAVHELAALAGELNLVEHNERALPIDGRGHAPLKTLDLRLLTLNNVDIPRALPLQIATVLHNPIFLEELERMSSALDSAFEEDKKRDQLMAEISSSISISLTAGFVSWMLNSGTLITGLLSTLPAWRQFDPLLILTAGRKRRKELPPETEQEKKVSAMFER